MNVITETMLSKICLFVRLLKKMFAVFMCLRRIIKMLSRSVCFNILQF